MTFSAKCWPRIISVFGVWLSSNSTQSCITYRKKVLDVSQTVVNCSFQFWPAKRKFFQHLTESRCWKCFWQSRRTTVTFHPLHCRTVCANLDPSFWFPHRKWKLGSCDEWRHSCSVVNSGTHPRSHAKPPNSKSGMYSSGFVVLVTLHDCCYGWHWLYFI